MTVHENFMNIALNEAMKAYDKKEIPVGCIIIYQNKIIAKSYNRVESLKDPTAHAEIMAITSAAEYLGSKVLKGCSLYVTLEPCSMCAGAIVLSKIDNLYFGAYDLKSGACGSVINVTNNKSLNHKCHVFGGVLDLDCGSLLKNFFKEKR
jgi:tRNA(adenine34) deaminase